MDSIIKAGLWETTIGGVHFVSRRKCTAVMVKAVGFLRVAGQLDGAGKPNPESVSEASQIKFLEAVMRAAVIEPVIAPEGEPTVPGVQYAFEDLQACADVWAVEFNGSGLSADPTPPSCEA